MKDNDLIVSSLIRIIKCSLIFTVGEIESYDEDDGVGYKAAGDEDNEYDNPDLALLHPLVNCWMKLGADKYYKALDKIDSNV